MDAVGGDPKGAFGLLHGAPAQPLAFRGSPEEFYSPVLSGEVFMQKGYRFLKLLRWPAPSFYVHVQVSAELGSGKYLGRYNVRTVRPWDAG